MDASIQPIRSAREMLNENGSIYLPESSQFFDKTEWSEIERIANSEELP